MALKWALYAEKYGLQHLAATCERFIMLHFMDMAGSPELEQVCLEAPFTSRLYCLAQQTVLSGLYRQSSGTVGFI